MNRLARAAATAAVAAVVLATLPAQHARPRRDASTRLHAARLRELLDLDVKGAIAEYQALAVERSGYERWIAVARLEELRRLGLPVSQPVPIDEAPQPVRAAIARMSPLSVEALVANGGKTPTEAGPATGGEVPLPPDLFAASREVEGWVRDVSGLPVSARLSTRQLVPTPELIRVFARDIVLRELEGRSQQAATLRDSHFRSWRPTLPTGTPAELLARVRTNLEGMIKAAPANSQRAELLGRLKDELEARQARDPAAALDLARRLPNYTEELFAEPPRSETNK